ncbi:GDP-mannose 4,6-dehydratase [Candidatus Pacearchaeota archaeon]|nr:GDP-mannose 4,6-dehydratase [Candidatus Pacearchaeota archaeon]
MIKKALITGVTGSGGSYLAEYIAQNHPDVDIHGITRWHSTSTHQNISLIKDKINLHECDLTDFSAVFEVIRKVQPDAIFHIASHANVRASFVNPLSVLHNNIMGTANLFEAIRLSGTKPLVQICSTSELYGQVDPRHVPITEDCPVQPVNPYAVSKMAQDSLGLTYFKSYGIPVIRTRMFAYLNPRRTDLFATSFAMQVARIEAGLQKELLHGNLDSTRTLIDVRDAMESYWIAMTKGRPGEIYNIGGNTVITVGQFLDVLKKLAQCTIPSRVELTLLRPVDVTLQIPDTSKFERETGWKPKYSFEESIKYLLDHCRLAVAREVHS